MTWLQSFAQGIGYLVMLLTVAWGLFIGVVGAINVIGSLVRGRNTSPLGTRQTAPTPAPAPGSFDASQPGGPGASPPKSLVFNVAPAVECAWCLKTIKDGTKPVSHTICTECGDREFAS